MKAQRRRGALCVVSLIAVLLSLSVTELFLRLTFVPMQRFPCDQHGILESDPIVGYRLVPNYRGTMSDGFDSAEIQINAMGFRDLYAKDYPDLGIIAVGDSETFGYLTSC